MNKKYIIMCGGKYAFKKQLTKIGDETLIERTIRLLRENGITDIAISTEGHNFDNFGVEVIQTESKFKYNAYDKECSDSTYSWLNAYYKTKEPVCYLHGDVYFSEDAIKKIVEVPVEDTLFICTYDGSDGQRHPLNVKGREPFGYKVQNQEVFQYAIKKLKQMVDNGKFINHLAPLSWHVYRFLNGLDIKPTASTFTDVNDIFKEKGDYLVINDETVDIDTEGDIKRLNEIIRRSK